MSPRRGSLEGKAADWLAGERADLREALAAASRRRDVARSETLFAPGSDPTGLWRIATGAIDLVVVDGLDEIPFCRLGSGACFGEEATLTDTPHIFGARAATDCVVDVVPPPALKALLAERPDWWPCFFRLAGCNLETVLEVRMEVAALPPASRLARRLLMLSGRQDAVTASKAELADFIGATRATVHKIVNDLSRAGAIESGYRRLIVRDRDALRRVAEGADV